MHAQPLLNVSYTTQGDAPQPPGMREGIKPPVLVAFGLVANALFWSGMALPFNATDAPEIAYLHVLVAVYGLAMAFGGALATLVRITNQTSVPVRSAEFAAGLLYMSVLTAGSVIVLTHFVIHV